MITFLDWQDNTLSQTSEASASQVYVPYKHSSLFKSEVFVLLYQYTKGSESSIETTFDVTYGNDIWFPVQQQSESSLSLFSITIDTSGNYRGLLVIDKSVELIRVNIFFTGDTSSLGTLIFKLIPAA